MNIKAIILISLLFCTVILNAQTDFRPGYVIKANADTIRGMIDYRSGLLMSSVCKFKDKNDVITEFLPADIEGYRFVNGKYYVSKSLDGEMAFFECLIQSRASIYYRQDEKTFHYYVDKADLKLAEIPYSEEVHYINGKKVFIKSKRHIGILQYYMQDAPALVSEIQAMKKPQHQNLIRLAEKYNNSFEDNRSPIVFANNTPFLQVDIEGLAGIVNYENIVDLKDVNYTQVGVIAYFWMPRTSEKVFFKTGFLYSKVSDIDGRQYGLLKIPTHVGYIAPKTYTVRPSFSVGLLSPSYSGGVSLKINKSINLGVQGWLNYNFKEVAWIPNRLLNYSILGSLYIDL